MTYNMTFSSGGAGASKLILRSSFIFTIVENLGLCVELTTELEDFLDVIFW